jgi:ATP-dependent Clp protease ATP-binding subunit ClpA
MTRSVVELAEAVAQRQRPRAALAAIVELRDRLDDLEEFHVDNARQYGWSWAEIAEPLRVTRQAVHRKHARRLADPQRGTGKGRIVVSADARRCVVRARREAAAFAHQSVGTDHLLLGLLAEKAIADAVAPLGITLDRALFVVTDLRGLGEPASDTRSNAGPIPISRRATRALEQSLHEALRLGDDSIEPRHLLLGLVRDEENGARRVLECLGASPSAIEERVSA